MRKKRATPQGMSLRTLRFVQMGVGAWYSDHVATAGAAPCGCSIDEPGKGCDLGEALWRLRPGSRGLRS